MPNSVMNFEQEKKLRALCAAMRKVAEAKGPLHPFWDAIFDIESYVAGRHFEVSVKRSADEWIALAEDYLQGAPI